MADLENKDFENEENEENDNVIELVDEDGESVYYEHLGTIEYEGELYLALCDPEAEESDEEEDLEVFILKIEKDENGEDVYTVPDDDVADKVFDKFLEMSEEEE